MSRRVNGIAIIEAEEAQTCTGCGASKECRPYGKNGAQVCYACAMATPESKAEAEKQMSIRLFGEKLMRGTTYREQCNSLEMVRYKIRQGEKDYWKNLFGEVPWRTTFPVSSGSGLALLNHWSMR